MKKNTSDSLDLARRIRAAGVAIHIAEDDEKGSCMPSDGLIIRQQGGVPDSTAFEFEGGTGYIIDLAITVNLPTIAIADFDLELPWEKICFRWLPDPLELGDSSMPYRFAGKILWSMGGTKLSTTLLTYAKRSDTGNPFLVYYLVYQMTR